ncbi:glycosyltransferase family 9 protein [Helicobacter heilmannii]|uniref:ADP-heptose--lipooligosaccharide heptosyltransferase II n=1 Tax=Helicobacter heilmannii TaxID=35817 RepID=A0A0K2XY49_HELHE|nr:glycosyltransferase family 9 protein [Helicobacter heilmannii]BDQ26603.1 ADP-heptose--LPS heptosyltransferase II [Helicobacter heilmannii]GMB94259.1 Lipopolysaccharide heptosyltransferase family protein [Helicobacter heilmannii]CRF49770.1 ADP-heptose--lipooligosaccharide heptosyltransferase II [Helicobacter heilmannii]CRI35002.1 ADP-heptose--lipooligosaccharide heptosyltransferase II [Helicobacter heilmannii]
MEKLLVVRNDKLGDFVLAWPAFAMLKASMPQTKLIVLVPSYTAELAHHCPYLDGVVVDAGRHASRKAKKQTLEDIKAHHFPAVISFFSTSHNAFLLFRAGIPFRLATATKLIQYLYTHRLRQRRSLSTKPEFVYNLDLARHFLELQNIRIVEPNGPPYWSFPDTKIKAQRGKLVQQFKLDPNKPWIFVHTGTGGSSPNLSKDQWIELILGLLKGLDAQMILSAGPTESQNTKELAQQINHPNIIVYDKNEGMLDFARSLACAQFFISAATGPLHLASALDIPTCAFYPARASAAPLRWQPINTPAKHLAFAPTITDPARDMDMSLLKIPQILEQLLAFIQQWLKG